METDGPPPTALSNNWSTPVSPSPASAHTPVQHASVTTPILLYAFCRIPLHIIGLAASRTPGFSHGRVQETLCYSPLHLGKTTSVRGFLWLSSWTAVRARAQKPSAKHARMYAHRNNALPIPAAPRHHPYPPTHKPRNNRTRVSSGRTVWCRERQTKQPGSTQAAHLPAFSLSARAAFLISVAKLIRCRFTGCSIRRTRGLRRSSADIPAPRRAGGAGIISSSGQRRDLHTMRLSTNPSLSTHPLNPLPFSLPGLYPRLLVLSHELFPAKMKAGREERMMGEYRIQSIST